MIKVEHYGVEGTGRTLKEAKADAGRKIKAMLEGDYTPETITFRGLVALIWREPWGGWYSKVISETGALDASRRLSGCASHSSRDEARASTRMQLAQMDWTAGDGLTVPEILIDEREAREFLSWARFQLAYQRFKADGLSEVDCHRQACEAMYAN